MTVADLTHRMSEFELMRWAQYADQRKMPTRRVEFAVARVAQVVAQAIGGSKAPLRDFLVEFVSSVTEPKKSPRGARKASGAMPAAVSAIGAVSGVGFYRLGQGRKARRQ